MITTLKTKNAFIFRGYVSQDNAWCGLNRIRPWHRAEVERYDSSDHGHSETIPLVFARNHVLAAENHPVRPIMPVPRFCHGSSLSRGSGSTRSFSGAGAEGVKDAISCAQGEYANGILKERRRCSLTSRRDQHIKSAPSQSCRGQTFSRHRLCS